MKLKQKDKTSPVYPELTSLAQILADELYAEIRDRAPKVESKMLYAGQYVLEEIVLILQGRV